MQAAFQHIGAELKHYIDEIDAKPQIVCIQETWLKDTSVFNIPGYNKEVKCRKDRQGGGVAIFIQHSLPYERIQNIPNEIEGLTVKVKLIGTDLTITNLYLPQHIKLMLKSQSQSSMSTTSLYAGT